MFNDSDVSPSRTLRQLLFREGTLGGVVWLLVPSHAISSAADLALVEWLILAGILVATPLAVDAGVRHAGRFWPRRHAWSIAGLHPLSAGCATVSVFVDPGPLAAALAAPWCVQAGLIALLGLRRLLLRGVWPLRELAVDAGHLYLAVGAAWFCASRLGLEQVMGFDPVITTLTAAHFHFAGLAAPVIAGQIGSLLAREGLAYRVGVILIILTPILVAVGILSSPWLEVVTSVLLALGVLTVAGLVLIVLWPRSLDTQRPLGERVAYGILGCAHLVSFATMVLACLYAVGEFIEHPLIGIPTMVVTHGLLNALGFAIPSLAALRWLDPPRASASEDVPFQDVRGALRIGSDHFDRRGLTADPGERPSALVASLDGMIQTEFPERSIHPDVRRFYEDTASLALVCRPHWPTAFALPGRLWVLFARWIGQMVLPVGRATQVIVSDLRPATFSPPGPTPAVISVRTYADGAAMYVASYADHSDGSATYMNIALPIPLFGSLQSNLRASPLGDRPKGCGLRLTSRGGPDGHEGLWLRFGALKVRLPLHETLVAWPASAPSALTGLRFSVRDDAVMVASHTFRLLGARCLTLDYALAPIDAPDLAGVLP